MDGSDRAGGSSPHLLWVGFVAALLLLSGVGWVVYDHRAAGPPSGGSGGPVGDTNLKIQHVVVIVLENREVGQVWALGPYQSYLQSAYGNATQYYALCHGSPPNYIAMTSGRAEDCGSNITGLINVTNLADVVERAGLTWAGYFESMPSPCYPYSTGPYVAWHDPFVSYGDIIGNATRCAAHVLPSDRFNTSVASGSLPTVSFYVPNTLDDCDNSSLIVCDAWLRGFLSPILNSTDPSTAALVGRTAFVVVYDEGVTRAGFSSPDVTSDCVRTTGKALATCGGQVYFALVSPYSAKTFDTSDATSYNLESTIEWLFGLPSDGGFDGSSSFPPMTSLFRFTSNAP